MLKKSPTSSSQALDAQALATGVAALEFLAAEPELLSRFLAITGLEPQQLRAEARRPAFFAGLLDFILDHQTTLDRFCASAEMDAETVATARRNLARAFGTTPSE